MSEAKQAEQAATNLLDIINEVIALVARAGNISSLMQSKTAVGSAEWHQHETIDDLLHEALAKLGD